MSNRQKIILLLTLVFCLFFQVLPSIRSGLLYSYGYGFWGPNGHDGIWHLSLIKNIHDPLSIDIPGFSGEILKNYHPFFDILLALIHHATPLSSSVLLFQVFPVVLGIAILIVSFNLGRLVTQSFLGGIYLMLTNTFATSFGWIVTLLQNGHFAGESMFWSMQSFSTFLNPPFALSLLFLLTLIWILLKNPTPSTGEYICIFLIITLSPITKAYSLVSIYTIFGLYSLRRLATKQYRPIIFFSVSVLTAFLIFNYYNPSTSGLLKWQPFWLIAGMFQSVDRFPIPKVSSAIFNLSQSSPHSLKLFLLFLFGSVIFIVGNFGFRILGFLTIKQPHLKKSYYDIYLALVLSVIIPLLFVQYGTGWNIVQFLYYGLFLGNILMVYYLFSLPSKRLAGITSLIIISLNLVGNIDNIKNYLGNPAPACLPLSEIKALDFLNLQKPGIVLTYPYDSDFKKNMHTPIPLYAYETNSYVSAYTQHATYLSDEMNLGNSRYNWQLRRDKEIRFFNQKALFEDRGFLLNNNIDYIYLTGIQTTKTSLNTDKLFLKNIYNDGQTTIYQVIK